MRRLPLLVLISAFACATVCGAVRAQPAAALGFVDQQVKQDVLLLRGYIETQAARHSFLYPTRAQVRKGGDFTYASHADGVSYGLELYRSTSPQVDLSGSVPQQVRNAADHLRNELVKANTEYLRAVVDRFALDNGDSLPAAGTVTVQGIYQYAFDYWPKNPWTGVSALRARASAIIRTPPWQAAPCTRSLGTSATGRTT